MADRDEWLKVLSRKVEVLVQQLRERYPYMPIGAVNAIASDVEKALKTIVEQYV